MYMYKYHKLTISTFVPQLSRGRNCCSIDNSFCTFLSGGNENLRIIWIVMHGILRIFHYCCLSGIVLFCSRFTHTRTGPCSWWWLVYATVFYKFCVFILFTYSSGLPSRYIKLGLLESECSTARNLPQRICTSKFRFVVLFSLLLFPFHPRKCLYV